MIENSNNFNDDDDVITRDKLLNHWMRFNQDYLQYILNVLFNGGLVMKITLQTFECKLEVDIYLYKHDVYIT